MTYGSVSITLSYMEIYKDEAFDLLVARENVGIVHMSRLTLRLSVPSLGSKATYSGGFEWKNNCCQFNGEAD